MYRVEIPTTRRETEFAFEGGLTPPGNPAPKAGFLFVLRRFALCHAG
jgi:hypothetical protein